MHYREYSIEDSSFILFDHLTNCVTNNNRAALNCFRNSNIKAAEEHLRQALDAQTAARVMWNVTATKVDRLESQLSRGTINLGQAIEQILSH